MVRRFRMIAGPNGSGKSTLRAWLSSDYAVNFYTFLNADDLNAELVRTGRCTVPFAFEPDELSTFVRTTSYDASVKEPFLDGRIVADGDFVRFGPDAVNTYTVALLTAFLQNGCFARGLSFSQETVMSHPSKIEALKRAQSAGYRTYLYYVATETPVINLERISNRAVLGGHAVPEAKTRARYARSLALLPTAFTHLSRAFFFDNSTDEMRYLASWSRDEGLRVQQTVLPDWFDQVRRVLAA